MRVSVIGCVLGCIVRWTRNDRSTQRGVGREHAMEANQMQPRRRDECGQPLHELQRRHHDMGGSVAVGTLELQHDLACLARHAGANYNPLHPDADDGNDGARPGHYSEREIKRRAQAFKYG